MTTKITARDASAAPVERVITMLRGRADRAELDYTAAAKRRAAAERADAPDLAARYQDEREARARWEEADIAHRYALSTARF